jgi:hypothetical protein
MRRMTPMSRSFGPASRIRPDTLDRGVAARGRRHPPAVSTDRPRRRRVFAPALDTVTVAFLDTLRSFPWRLEPAKAVDLS